jgi:ABC-type lipoprotein release transport system permease subunit
MSRGATKQHLLLINSTQALLIGGISFIVGPLVANVAISSTGYLPFFSGLGRSGPLPTNISAESFIYGGIGAFVSFIVLMLPALASEDTNPLEQRVNDVRPATKSFIQRWYIDVVLAVMTLFFIAQLNQQGSLVSDVFAEGSSVSLVLLFVPVLFLVSTSLLLLRLVPYITAIAARLIVPVSTVWLALGLWQISRNPQNITRLILLLVLASGLGAFSANFGGTLDRSYEERALYSAGTQTRFTGANLAGTGPSVDFQKSVEQVEGVKLASPVLRQEGSFSGEGAPGLRYELLGVDPDQFSKISWWRDDFADKNLGELMSSIESELTQPYGLTLPVDSTKIGVWIEPVETSPRSSLVGVMMDSNGRYFSIYFGTLEQEGLHFLETEIKPVSRRGWGRRTVEVLEPKAPFTLLSIQIVQRSRSSGMEKGAFYINSITTMSPQSPKWLELHQFEEGSNWNILDLGVMTRSDSLKFITYDSINQSQRALFSWAASGGFVQRGIYYGPSEYKIPMLVSSPLLRSLNQDVGDTIILALGTARATGKIVGTVDHFPTLDPVGRGGFIIVNLDDIVRQQNLVGQSDEVQANEIWTVIGAEPLSDDSFSQLTEIVGTSRYISRENLISQSKADPLVAAGWKTILMVSYLSVLFLGIVGYISHAVLMVGERRNQFALLRTMGLTGSQIRLVVWFEHIVVMLIGIVAGFFIGQRTGSLLMPFLDRTETGISVQPPFVLEINWEALGLVYLLMVIVFVICTIVVVKIYNKVAIGQALRIGED